MKEKDEVQDYLESLTYYDVLSIIKYGLRNSNAPEGVTVEDLCTRIAYLYFNYN